MLPYLVSYALALVIFVAIDMVWLGTMSSVLYRPVLGDILLDTVRIGPAIVFYLLYPLAIVIFAVAPALKAESVMPALIYGALFGFFAYATYDLTNFATLRNWTWQITVIDCIWGAFVTGLAASLAYLATIALVGKLG